MYIEKYWGEYIGESDDSLSLVAFWKIRRKKRFLLAKYLIR